MTRLSGFFDPRGARATANVPPRLQFSGPTGRYSYVRSAPNENGQFVPQHTDIPFGQLLIIDFGAAERGYLQYRPFDDSCLVPFHCEMPEPPDDGDYVLVVRLPVLLQGPFDLAQWTLGGTIGQNSLLTVYRMFEYAAEAAAGKIQVCRLRPSQQIAIASRAGEMHNKPIVEVVGWIDRDERRFGPRTVPPPLPLVSAAAPSQSLPLRAVEEVNSDDLFAVLPPAANDDGQAQPVDPEPAPSPPPSAARPSAPRPSAPPPSAPAPSTPRFSNQVEKAVVALAKDGKAWTAREINSKFRIYLKDLNELVEAGRLIKTADDRYRVPSNKPAQPDSPPVANQNADPFDGMTGTDKPPF
jgi:hypothetical protein